MTLTPQNVTDVDLFPVVDVGRDRYGLKASNGVMIATDDATLPVSLHCVPPNGESISIGLWFNFDRCWGAILRIFRQKDKGDCRLCQNGTAFAYRRSVTTCGKIFGRKQTPSVNSPL